MHVLAYACDPSYQSHKLSEFEYKQCTDVLKRLRPNTYTQALVELKQFKRNPELFDGPTWLAVDTCHGYLWWDAFGGDLPVLQSVSCDILSKQTFIRDRGQYPRNFSLFVLSCCERGSPIDCVLHAGVVIKAYTVSVVCTVMP